MDLNPTERLPGEFKASLGYVYIFSKGNPSPVFSTRAEARFNSLNPKSRAVSCVHLGNCSIETLFWQVYSQ